MPSLDPGFREHLLGIFDLTPREIDRFVEELLDHWSETPDRFVRRRHAELQREGVKCRTVYGVIADEMADRRFASRPLSERQVRRMIYG